MVDLLARAGVGVIGTIDYDKVSLSNIHRQTLYTTKDVGKYKVEILKKKLNLINKEIKVNIYNQKANEKNLIKIINKYNVSYVLTNQAINCNWEIIYNKNNNVIYKV